MQKIKPTAVLCVIAVLVLAIGIVSMGLEHPASALVMVRPQIVGHPTFTNPTCSTVAQLISEYGLQPATGFGANYYVNPSTGELFQVNGCCLCFEGSIMQ